MAARVFYLGGWNLHDQGVLTQNLSTLAEADPDTGATRWERPIKEVTGSEDSTSDLRCMISQDGKFFLSTCEAENEEIKSLDGPSFYLVRTDLPDGKPQRLTPKQFDAAHPFLEADGANVLLRGFTARDVTRVKGGDGVKLKARIYRYCLETGKLTPLVEGGDNPSTSRN